MCQQPLSKWELGLVLKIVLFCLPKSCIDPTFDYYSSTNSCINRCKPMLVCYYSQADITSLWVGYSPNYLFTLTRYHVKSRWLGSPYLAGLGVIGGEKSMVGVGIKAWNISSTASHSNLGQVQHVALSLQFNGFVKKSIARWLSLSSFCGRAIDHDYSQAARRYPRDGADMCIIQRRNQGTTLRLESPTPFTFTDTNQIQ